MPSVPCDYKDRQGFSSWHSWALLLLKASSDTLHCLIHLCCYLSGPVNTAPLVGEVSYSGPASSIEPVSQNAGVHVNFCAVLAPA